MTNFKICVVGLGYVGLPLAVELSKHYPVIGYDYSKKKVDLLINGIDPTREVGEAELKKAKITLTTDPKIIKQCNFIIIAVPTPVDKANVPDLTAVRTATETVGKNLSKGATVVYESTVYPGVTEDICVPILEKESKLKCGKDFKVGYSPERINPGDKEHTLQKIVKVVSGMDNESLETIAKVYSSVTQAGVYKASSIKVAEAAKVIENVQRDLNISLMNELSLIFARLGIDTGEVLAAACTKWNFLKFTPGLVGGHCIGVDPYYLTYKAQELGYHPSVIIAGREVNDYMAHYVAELTVKGLNSIGKAVKGSKILVLGLTFKENVNDCRNSKITDAIKDLLQDEAVVEGYDPNLTEEIVHEEFGIPFVPYDKTGKYDAIILAAMHKEFKKLSLDDLKKKFAQTPVLIDVKGMFNKDEATKKGFVYHRL